ncbi:hypothetical protein BKA69DRAFT_793994 [Paraphysoderma sedebokerense]|nr:hypothetical protein BKA69DRAFT_793994 [Paraphysoderma sedebokerense]
MAASNKHDFIAMTASTSPTGVPVRYEVIRGKCGGQVRIKNADSNGVSYSLKVGNGWKCYEVLPSIEPSAEATDKSKKDKKVYLIHVEQPSVFSPFTYGINRKLAENTPAVTALKSIIRPYKIWTKPYLHFFINGHSFVALRPDSKTTAEVRLLFAPLNERNVQKLVENVDYYVVGRLSISNSCSCCAERDTGVMQIWENYLSTVATSPAPYAVPLASGSNLWGPLANEPAKFDKLTPKEASLIVMNISWNMTTINQAKYVIPIMLFSSILSLVAFILRYAR